MKKAILLLLALFIFCCLDNSASASYDKTAYVLANSVKYIRGFHSNSSELVVGIIYNPTESASKNEAEHFFKAINNISNTNALTLKAKLVPINQFREQSDLDIAYLTRGLNSNFTELYDISKEQGLFTVSSDMDCVTKKCCILSINSSSGVEIYLNETTMRELGFDVNAAFKFMVERV